MSLITVSADNATALAVTTSATNSLATSTPAIISTITSTSTVDALDPRTGFSTVIPSLQAAGNFPAGGKLLFSLPDGYATTNSVGENFLSLGAGQTAQDFVLGVQLGWYVAANGSACGLSFRAGQSDWRSVLITSDGRLLLTRQVGTVRSINADLPISMFTGKPYKNALWLSVNGRIITVFINGKIQTTVVDDPTRGGFALDVYNAQESLVFTDCRYRNLWVWSYDDDTRTVTPSLPVTNSQ